MMTRPGAEPPVPPAAPTARSLSRTAAHTFGANVLLVLLAFATSVAVARTLGPAMLGGYELAMATAMLILQVVSLSLPSGITYVVARGVASLRSLRRQLTAAGILQGIVALAAAEALRRSTVSAGFFPDDASPALTGLVAAYVLVLGFAGVGRAILVGGHHVAVANRIEVLGRVLQLAAVLGAALTVVRMGGTPTHTALFGATVAATGMAAAAFWWASLRVPSGYAVRGSGIREALRFARPSHAANLAQFLNYRVDLFLIGYIVGLEGAGLYALATMMAQLVWLLSSAAATVLFPFVASTSSEATRGAVTARLVRTCLAASVLGAMVVGGAAGHVVPLVFGPRFADAVPALIWLLPGIAVFSAANVLAAYFGGIGRPSINSAASILGLMITVPLALVLIPRYGIAGASVASSVSYVASTLVLIAAFRRNTGRTIGELLLPRVTDVPRLRLSAAFHGR